MVFRSFIHFGKVSVFVMVAVWEEINSALEKLVMFLFWFLGFVVGVEYFLILKMCLSCMPKFFLVLSFLVVFCFFCLKHRHGKLPQKAAHLLASGCF